MTTILAFFLYGIFVTLDYICLPNSPGISIVNRLIICLLYIVAFYATFVQNFMQKFHQLVISIMCMIGTFGILHMIFFSKSTELAHMTYYEGLFDVMTGSFILGRLLFFNAILVAGFMLITYGGSALYYQTILHSPESNLMYISNFMTITVAFIIGLVCCYLFEKNSRLDFLTRYTIAVKAQDLLVYYENTKPSPKEFLDLINGIRHSPTKLQELLNELIAFRNS
jgi:hypothetical protein